MTLLTILDKLRDFNHNIEGQWLTARGWPEQHSQFLRCFYLFFIFCIDIHLRNIFDIVELWPCDIFCILLLLFPAEISLKAAYSFGLVWGKEVSAIFSIVMTAQEDSTILLGLLSERAASGRGLRAVTTSWVAPRPRSFKAIHNLQIGSRPNIQTNSWVDLGLCNSIYQHISVLIPILEYIWVLYQYHCFEYHQ